VSHIDQALAHERVADLHASTRAARTTNLQEMRRQPIVKSLTVVAALSACAVAAPTALAHTGINPTPFTNNEGAVARSGFNTPPHIASTPFANNAGAVAGLGYNVPRPDTSKAVVVKQQPGSSSPNDLRSPDAKAAAADPGALTYATPTVIKVGSSGGFDWGDAGIGAGGMLALVALAGGGLVLVSRRRTTHPRVSPTAG
jgi:hypothetical protein